MVDEKRIKQLRWKKVLNRFNEKYFRQSAHNSDNKFI